MILRQEDDEWKVFTQHDHAYISWQIAANWKAEYFPFTERKDEVLFAIRHHDRAWLPLDRNIRWDEENEKPYDFTSYPLTEKLSAYSRGISEVEAESPYAALLCSRHYASFFSFSNKEDDVIRQFLQKEKERRQHILRQLVIEENEQIEEHLKLLQFCDDLSLYICLNSPGVEKESEFPWFKHGFRQHFHFAPGGIGASWLNEKTIEVSPFPFEHDTDIEFSVYSLKKDKATAIDVQNWEKATPAHKVVNLVQN